MNQPLLLEFQETIWNYYKSHGRTFSWRYADDPYKIVVSEIMLQQTQTQRVIEKYSLFIQRFPTFNTLAHATLQEVLLYWQGLGYNRRGKYLHEIAKIVMQEYKGTLPSDPEILKTLPGIGSATAASICAFAYNAPTVFIETNIRTVFIHFFFKDKSRIKDSDILPLVAATVPENDARSWYYALMDYGVMLKKSIPNPSRKSAHHTKQSRFEGSDRQIRGKIIKELTCNNGLSFDGLCERIEREPQRIIKALEQLINEQFIQFQNSLFSIK